MRNTFVVAAVAALLTASSTPALAAGNRLVARWSMNESSSARTMTDSSGNGRNGRIGRDVDTGVRVSGETGYRFERLEPDVPPARPQHIVTVPDSSALDPGDRDYAVTLRLRTTGKFGNIIQKGQATVAGGNFKLQIPSGIVQCLYRGSRGTLIVTAPRAINNGQWHTVSCERTRSGVTLDIDGQTVARKSGWVGTISNSWPVAIGGKSSCDQIKVGCDYYNGDVGWVEITAG